MAFAAVQWKRARPDIPTPSHLQQIAKAPDFEFVAHDGTKVSTAGLAGKIWVANFIFTRCPDPCPTITSRMAELQQKLGRTRPGEIQLLTFTVDPEYDTPEVLHTYAEAVGARPERWRFLTGPKPQIEQAVRNGFLQPLVAGDDGNPVHSARFVLVDREGWMRSLPDGNDPEVVQKLLLDIGDLLRENPKP